MAAAGQKPMVVCILGPTATGKTDLAISLAEQLPCDLISVDSALMYRGMDIGTAKPTANELQKTPHRLLDICEPDEAYSAGCFCADAAREIESIVAQNRIPLLVGGTMLYFHKLLYGMAALPTADPILRESIEAEAKQVGWAALHQRLEQVDPVAAQKIKPQDRQRIARALEVYQMTGEPISVLQQQNSTALLQRYDVKQIALIPEDRAWLHQRIAKRFESMLAAGFLDEVEGLHKNPKLNADMTAMRMVGYRQAWQYLDGEIDYDTLKNKAIAATRQLAKRQLTWLRRWEGLAIFDPRDPVLFEKVMRLLTKD